MRVHSLCVCAIAAAALVLPAPGEAAEGPGGLSRIPSAALRPPAADVTRQPGLSLTVGNAGITALGGSVQWVQRGRGGTGDSGGKSYVLWRWQSGRTLGRRDWPVDKASVCSSCQLIDGVRDGTPSGARIGDHALHIAGLPTTGLGVADVHVCRGPALARIVVILVGRPDDTAARLAEQLAERFCWRVDRALEYIHAKTFTLKAGGEKLECRQAPSGALVGDLGALCDAIDAGIRVEEDGEVVLLRRGKKEVRLQVGYETAQVGKAGAKLHFPTLRWSEDSYIADLSGIAMLLGAKVEY